MVIVFDVSVKLERAKQAHWTLDKAQYVCNLLSVGQVRWPGLRGNSIMGKQPTKYSVHPIISFLFVVGAPLIFIAVRALSTNESSVW